MNTSGQRHPFNRMFLLAWDTYTRYFSFYLIVTVILLLPFNLADAYFFTPGEPGPFGVTVINLLSSTTSWALLVSNITTLTWADLFSTNPTVWVGYAVAFLGFFVGVFHSIVVVVGTRATLRPNTTMPHVGTVLVRSSRFFVPALTTMLLLSVLTLPLLAAFIVPGVIAVVYWSFAVPEAVVLVRYRNVAALRISYHLVRHHWWEVVWRSLLITAPIVVFITTLLTVTEPFINNPLIAATVTTLSDIAVVFIMVYFVFYFYDLFQGHDAQSQEALLSFEDENKEE